MLSNILIVGFTMIGGCFVPISIFPKFIDKISYFTPIRWAMESVIDLQQGVSFNSIIINLCILILFAGAFLVVAAYRTKKADKIYKNLG